MTRTRGFTLIELIIVIAIIGVFAVTVTSGFWAIDKLSATTSTVSSPVVQPTGPAPTCSGGYLLKGNTAVTNSAGEAVKC